MQADMHFYGTYVLARAAGIPRDDAHTIAYAAQFVDDSTETNSTPHPDGGLLFGTATAHHNAQVVANAKVEPDEHRRVWVPFHFFPGGRGDTLEEKLLCVKDSEIVNSLVMHHLEKAKSGVPFGLELVGLTAHVYMDTFSHYGFSGIGSKYNGVDGNSFELIDVKNEDMKAYILKKKKTLSKNTVQNDF